MIIYVIARSPETALTQFLQGQYYTIFEDAARDLKQFCKEWHKIFEVDIPINEV